MLVCAQCGAENEDRVKGCAKCGGTRLVTPEAHRKASAAGFSEELDTRKFVSAAVAEDPLSSQRFQRVLEAAQIPVFARPRTRSGLDGITASAFSTYWELLVPEEHAERAAGLLAKERAQMESSADENARAAEQEEAETHGDKK